MAQSKQVPLDEVEGIAGFPVTVQATIGHVVFDDLGKESAVEAAMRIIGRFHNDHIETTGDTSDSVYRFLGPGDRETITVTIEHHRH